MTDYRGVTWRVNYGEISERNQFRVGYVNQASYDAYFELGSLSDLISVLNDVVGLAVGQVSRGTSLQARKVSDGLFTSVRIEPRLDTGEPAQIMLVKLGDVTDLLYALGLFQADLPNLPLPDDWDASRTPEIVLLDRNGKLPESAVPDRLSPDQLSAKIAEGVDPVVELATSNRRRAQAAIKRKSPGVWRRHVLPAGFWDDCPVRIWTDGLTYRTDYNVKESHRPTGGKTYYVDIVSGSNSYDGLTPATARPTVSSAQSLAVAGDTIVILDKGVVFRSQYNINSVNPLKGIAIVAENPKQKIVHADKLTWSQHGTYPKVWQAARTNVGEVIDTADDEDGIPYEKAASLALCATTPGSWYTDGPNVFVRRPDGKMPDNNSLFCLLAAQWNMTGPITAPQAVYMENVHFYGGESVLKVVGTVSNAVSLYAYECGFRWTSGPLDADGLDLDDLQFAFLHRCVVTDSRKDGINHGGANRAGHVLELECRSARHGVKSPSGSSMNASTAHSGIHVLRINGLYHTSMGGVVADAQTTWSHNLGCKSFGSLTKTGGALDAAWAILDAGGRMDILGGMGFDAGRSLSVGAGATANVDSAELDTIVNNGTINVTNPL